MANFEAIVNDLKEGNCKYQNDNQVYCKTDKVQLRNDNLTDQHPKVIVLSCADSRVPAELIFNKSIGELFVVRVAGNVANSASMASIEYAIAVLNAKVLVVKDVVQLMQRWKVIRKLKKRERRKRKKKV